MLRDDIRLYVIRPALKMLNLWSQGAEMLVYGTGMVESDYNALKQVSGIALGVYQCEPETHSYIKQYLKKPNRKELLESILGACQRGVMPDDEALIWDLYYATMICRVRYLDTVAPIPDWDNAQAMAQYHADYYNRGGKANVDENSRVFKMLIQEVRYNDG